MRLLSHLFNGRSVRDDGDRTPAWMEPLEGRRMMAANPGLGPAAHPTEVEAFTILAVLQASGAEFRGSQSASENGATVVRAYEPGTRGKPLAILVGNPRNLTVLVSDEVLP